MSASTRKVAVIRCPRSKVKVTKTALEKAGTFGKKIEKYDEGETAMVEPWFWIWTSFQVEDGSGENITLKELGIPEDIRENLTISIRDMQQASTQGDVPSNPLLVGARQFLEQNTPPQSISVSDLLSQFPDRYNVYQPLLLLPSNAFSPTWETYLSTLSPSLLTTFYTSLCSSLSCTHLSINQPIPTSDPVRKPLNLTPLHGDFGTTGAFINPTKQDFNSAFWVTHKQNNITQCWAPMYTMFSRGNIKEKARVAEFKDVKGRIVADFYVGIGYFAFSYLKAGARRVFCWEVNAWSVEGLRRGAKANGWGVVRIVRGEGIPEGGWGDEVKLVVFEESNEYAEERLGDMRRLGILVDGPFHINLGLLPSSRDAWIPAARSVERGGGWIHIHENLAEEEIEEKAKRICEEISLKSGRRAGLRHIERVKTFAPRVIHCVLDVRISESEKE